MKGELAKAEKGDRRSQREIQSLTAKNTDVKKALQNCETRNSKLLTRNAQLHTRLQKGDVPAHVPSRLEVFERPTTEQELTDQEIEEARNYNTRVLHLPSLGLGQRDGLIIHKETNKK